MDINNVDQESNSNSNLLKDFKITKGHYRKTSSYHTLYQ